MTASVSKKTSPSASKSASTKGAAGARPHAKTPPSSKGSTPSHGKRLTWSKVLIWGGSLCVWGLVLLGVVLAYYAYDLPDVDVASEVSRRPGVTIYDANNNVLASRGDLYGEAVQLRDLPAALPQAVMATEDRRFYDHIGLDFIGLARAAVVNAVKGRVVQGGSTLTQQVAKNLFLSPDRTLKRKIQELLLALWLEQKFSKEQILTLYLNRVYLGAGTYGVEAAAQKYFGKSARQLSLYESAMMAGLLKAPSRYNPSANPDLAAKRTAVVLANMVKAGYLSAAQAEAAKRQTKKTIASARPSRIGRYFVDWVFEQVDDFAGDINGDVIVETTIDTNLQRLLEDRLSEALTKYGKKYDVSEAAMVIMRPDGAVLAMVGGRNYAESQFNRATQAIRQPGSAFKPFVYLSALEQGVRPDDVYHDGPIKIANWAPKNYMNKYYGDVTLSQALDRSLNTVAAQIAQKVGVQRIADTAQRLGITSPLVDDLSLSLGTSGVTLLELTSAYGSFANGGYGVFAHGITQITRKDGQVLYARQGGGTGQIINADILAQMNRMMVSVVDNGTGQKAKLAGRQIAGKTGTTQNNRDAWFVGYSADLVAGLWLGNDSEKPMKNATGGGLAAEIWHSVMAPAHQHIPVHPLPGLETISSSPPEAPSAPSRDSGPNLLERIFSVFN